MSGDVHVRFRERLGGQFPGPTRLVICCRGTAAEAEVAMVRMMARLKLTVNRDKTHRCRLPEHSFDFVGYTFGRCYSPQTGRAYIGTRPSKKSIRRVCREICALTARGCVLAEPRDRVERLNRLLVGWANYFSVPFGDGGNPSPSGEA